MVIRRRQVLTNRQQIDVVGAHIFELFDDFLIGLTEPYHQPRLGRHIRITLLEALQKIQRVCIIGTGASLLV